MLPLLTHGKNSSAGTSLKKKKKNLEMFLPYALATIQKVAFFFFFSTVAMEILSSLSKKVAIVVERQLQCINYRNCHCQKQDYD